MKQLTRQEVEAVVERQSKLCTVNGCFNKHTAKGLCKTHYGRVLRHGSVNLPDKNPHNMYGTRPYIIWSNMVQRCTNRNHTNYPRYGGRGILIPTTWKTFPGFWADMQDGYNDNLTLDRIDNERSYSKHNCRWATRKEQNRNTSRTRLITINGETLCVSDWAIRYNIPIETIRDRLSRGWKEEDAIMIPSQTHSKRKRSQTGQFIECRSERTF